MNRISSYISNILVYSVQKLENDIDGIRKQNMIDHIPVLLY